MKSIYRVFLNFFILFIVMMFLSSCARKTLKPSFETKKDTGKTEAEVVVKPPEKTEKIAQPEMSTVEILYVEAKKFISQENYFQALLVYSQALSHADENESQQLMMDIESALEKTQAKDILKLMDTKGVNIPEPLLLYWCGHNLALENKTEDAKKILEAFLSDYPGHTHAADAMQLVTALKKSFFHGDTIGCLLPLTGKYAVFGQRALTGIQLAIQELSEKYSKQFKLIIKDTQANPDIAVECVRKLDNKNVAGIIGPLLNVNEAGLEAEKLGIPMIALTQKDEFPFQGDYLFSNFITPEMQVRTLGAYLFLKLGIKKVAVLYPNEKYGKKYMNFFWDIVDEYGGEMVSVEAYDGTKTDFTQPIQKLTGKAFSSLKFLEHDDYEPEKEDPLPEGDEKSEDSGHIDFQALFIPDSPSTVSLILPQLSYNDISGIYLVGTNLWHNDTLLEDSKGYNKKAVITDGFFEESMKTETAGFTKKFEALFHKKPKFLEAISYDTAFILFSAAMDKTIDSREALKDTLQGKRIFPGVTGNTIFDEDGVAHRELFLITIKSGKFVEISR